MLFMNFGYSSDDEQVLLESCDEVNRYYIQMYHHAVGNVELRDRDVLEVGSGRGGGASYVARYLQPKSMTGIDISANAVAFCNQHHHVERLRFLQGDAESLPFNDNTFDVLINIESSYGYGHMNIFLREVARVLRPNGYFLFADYRNTGAIDTLRDQLRQSGLIVRKDESITNNVLQALDRDNERKRETIQRKVPPALQKAFFYFAAMQGSKRYQALKTGSVDYRCFMLSKVTTL